MRVAFCGKGGSGKSTISSLFALWLEEQCHPVLAIDADLNQHLGTALGLSPEIVKALPEMGTDQDALKTYIRGSNPLIPSNDVMIKTSLPYQGSQFLTLSESNPVYDYYAHKRQSLRFIRLGTFHEDDIGVNCYHSKTGMVELLLNHTLDTKNETIIVDMTAGVDSFASGLFTRFDVTFLVVEPTLQGLSVYNQYREYAKDFDVPIRVIGNKIQDTDDQAFLQDHVGEDLIAAFPQSRWVKARERGKHDQPISELEDAAQNALQSIENSVRGCVRDWDRYWAQAVAIHLKTANASWYAAISDDLKKQVNRAYLQKLTPEKFERAA